jgi:hypothetical protein
LEHTTYISEKEQVDSEACTIITIEDPYKNEELVIFFTNGHLKEWVEYSPAANKT